MFDRLFAFTGSIALNVEEPGRSALGIRQTCVGKQGPKADPVDDIVYRPHQSRLISAIWRPKGDRSRQHHCDAKRAGGDRWGGEEEHNRIEACSPISVDSDLDSVAGIRNDLPGHITLHRQGYLIEFQLPDGHRCAC